MGIIDKLRARESDDRRADAQARRSATGPTTEIESNFEPTRDSSTVMLPPTLSAPSTIISDAPSRLQADFADSRMQPLPAETSPLPLLKGVPAPAQRVAMIALAVIGAGLIAAALVLGAQSGASAPGSSAVADAQTQVERLARAAHQAVSGQPQALAEVPDAARALGASGGALAAADSPVAVRAAYEPLAPIVERIGRQAAALNAQAPSVTKAAQGAAEIRRKAALMEEPAEALLAAKLQSGAAPADVAAAAQLVTLAERIGRAASELQALRGTDAEVMLLLGKDVEALGRTLEGLAGADPAPPRGAAPRDAAQQERLKALNAAFGELRVVANDVLGAAQGLIAARAAQASIAADALTMSRGLAAIRQQAPADPAPRGVGLGGIGLGALGLLLAVLGGLGWARVFVHEQTGRSRVADTLRAEAEKQEQEAKRVNDANQAAILRLMNELQSVAEGDLTQQATVTEDITGAIADSVNYTVEELRSLVSQVQSTVVRVAATTEKVEETSTELLAASTEQLREIHETGESVLRMASRINDVSSKAQRTAEVAQDSLKAAESGLTAVQNSIGGMNLIREQIQDTSKRIKRLGESSQEIGEITELISDITEQTNVLALNAAIQAASAGEAGRGFSVVAEEVQRLAERSADATRQIAALVRAIQTDTQDAVAAMERSTQGVVEGAHLSDAAGTALAEIDRVTRELSELIQRISSQALEEAASANVVATNIQHIFAVTEQTSEGTKSTAQMVRELSRTAEELRSSVARFKVS